MNPRYLGNPLRNFLTSLQMYRNKQVVNSLLNHRIKQVRMIGTALRDTLNFENSEEDNKLISRIEQRRSFLLSCEAEIAIIDYGAGQPTSKRSLEEMEKGIHSVAKVSDICKASKTKFFATMLFNFIRNLKPSSCIELGSLFGISAAYQATALQINGSGNLVTLEGSPETAKVAEETFRILNLSNVNLVKGPFHETLDNVLKTSRPIDYFFNDGHHDRVALLKYFNQAIPYLADGAVIVFDDISWSSGMKEAWRIVENDRRVAVTIDLGSMGVALIKSDRLKRENYKIPL